MIPIFGKLLINVDPAIPILNTDDGHPLLDADTFSITHFPIGTDAYRVIIAPVDPDKPDDFYGELMFTVNYADLKDVYTDPAKLIMETSYKYRNIFDRSGRACKIETERRKNELSLKTNFWENDIYAPYSVEQQPTGCEILQIADRPMYIGRDVTDTPTGFQIDCIDSPVTAYCDESHEITARDVITLREIYGDDVKIVKGKPESV